MGNALRLGQVVINAVTNAIKYTPEGGDISLVAERDCQNAVVRVRDSGVGIPHEMLERVFEPFVRADTSEARSRPAGLGIGLALAKRIVQLHAGTIEARSAGSGLGTELVMRLPLADRRGPVTPGAPLCTWHRASGDRTRT
jgi:signal transduction histidine kinase